MFKTPDVILQKAWKVISRQGVKESLQNMVEAVKFKPNKQRR